MNFIKNILAHIKIQGLFFIVLFFQLLHIIDEFQRDWSGIYSLKQRLLLTEMMSHDMVSFIFVCIQLGLGIFSICSLYLLIYIVYLLFSKKRYLVVIGTSCIFTVYFLLLSYLYTLEIPFDFAIFILNYQSILAYDFILASLPYVRTGPLILFVLCSCWLFCIPK